jgi:23S rRNA pseudouridine1911/1915/1917 synthase
VPEKIRLTNEDFVDKRLDKTLSLLYPFYSRSVLAKLIDEQKVLVNGKAVKAKYILKFQDNISVDLTSLTESPQQIKIPILYQDEDVIVLNKPEGVLTHSKGAFNEESTVASFIKPFISGSEQWRQSNRAGIIHRLDRGTSGVILCAKNEDAQKFLQKQFANRNVKKTYLALVVGDLEAKEGVIEVPIERNPKKPSAFRAGANGKSAITQFRVDAYKNNVTRLILMPTTGRTHQLRVHMAYINHPIVGDSLYGGVQSHRIMLHAAQLEVTLPSRVRQTFSAPIPKEFDI